MDNLEMKQESVKIVDHNIASIAQKIQHVNIVLEIRYGKIQKQELVDFSVNKIAFQVKMVVIVVMIIQVYVILVCKIITGMLMNKNV